MINQSTIQKHPAFHPIFLLILMLFLSACSSTTTTSFAPVVDGFSQHTSHATYYKVQPGDTLYSIASRYGLDYQKLAKVNGISKPYSISTGQKLSFEGSSVNRKTYQVQKSATHNKQLAYQSTSRRNTVNKRNNSSVAQSKQSKVLVDNKDKGNYARVTNWQWPTQGQVVQNFSTDPSGKKGIDISGKSGTPVYASASGVVVYSGNGLRPYGELIIIKHNSQYLSAYAHNKKILVKEGTWVQAGQEIAEMGDTGSDKVMLHFEIRKDGKPVDPLRYLPKYG